MLIRSQDKKRLVNMNSLETIGIGENKVMGSRGSEDSLCLLGEYSNEKKAIRVLDMIQDEYLYCERCKVRGEEAGSIPLYVFQMPKDDEVMNTADTNIYKISDIQKAYQCSYSEATKARKLLFFLRSNLEELEEIFQNDIQEDLLKFCLKYAKEDKKVTLQEVNNNA